MNIKHSYCKIITAIDSNILIFYREKKSPLPSITFRCIGLYLKGVVMNVIWHVLKMQIKLTFPIERKQLTALDKWKEWGRHTGMRNVCVGGWVRV